MSVKKLYGNTYYADYRDCSGRRKRVSLQTDDLEVAKAKYALLIDPREGEKSAKITPCLG